jgi:hypothetical protein
LFFANRLTKDGESDLRKLVAGIKITRQLFQLTAFDDFRGEEAAAGAVFNLLFRFQQS